MVRNESDVIETFIRHNLTLLNELHVVDHNSSDNTREILTLLKQEGLPIHIYHYNELEFAPERVLNHMMQHILNNDADIDYIFPLDADELIYCPSREILHYFLSLIPQGVLECIHGEAIYQILQSMIQISFATLPINEKKKYSLLK